MVRRKNNHEAIDSNQPKQKRSQVVLIDFGFSTDLSKNDEPLLKRCGTVGYLAPEQLKKSDEDIKPSVKADVYAAGVILHELVYGSHPFKPEGTVSLKEVMSLNRKARIDLQANKPLMDFPESRI